MHCMTGIPLYAHINDLHCLTGSALRTDNPLFHCFDMAEANDLMVDELPPHRVDFYTLALNFGTQNLSYTLNEATFQNPQNFVLCAAPGHVATWKKQGSWFGYCTFFKSEFLQFRDRINFLQQYPFFSINETNLVPVDAKNYRAMRVIFEQILHEQAHINKFSAEIIQSHFQGILWQVRRLYEATTQKSPSQRAASIITARFQYLVNEHFREVTTVDAYAQRLSITANHLSQTIKQTTGRTAKQIIAQRRGEEARYLLAYTDSDIAEIAYHLSFSEPTHFTKFFKKESGQSPSDYRAARR